MIIKLKDILLNKVKEINNKLIKIWKIINIHIMMMYINKIVIINLFNININNKEVHYKALLVKY